MGKTAYPTAADLNSYLTEAGFTLGGLDTTTAVAAAVDEFHRRTGRIMLAPAGTTTRYYDPPTASGIPGGEGGGFLSLGADLAVLTAVVYQPQGAEAETLVQNADFRLHPYGAGSEDEGPFLAVEFRRRWTRPLLLSLRRAVQVTGRWGYAVEIPEDAWNAMLQRGAALLAPSRGGKLSGGHVRTEDSGVVRVYGDDPLAGLRRAWEGVFEAVVRRYRVVRM